MTNEPCDTQIEELFQNLVAILIENGCWVSVVVVETCSGLRSRVRVPAGTKYFYRPNIPALEPIILLFYGYRGFFPGDKGGRSVKSTTLFHLAPKLRVSGAIPPLSLYAFKALAGKSLPSPLLLPHKLHILLLL